MFILELAKTISKAKLPYAIVGGYAVALHGAVRGTMDVDLVLNFSRKDFVRAEQAFKSMGLVPRLPVTAEQVFDFREDYLKNRNLVAWSFYNPKKPIEIVDVILTENLAEIRVKRIKLGDVTLRIASIKDLIRMKTASGRAQDLADIEGLKALRGGVES